MSDCVKNLLKMEDTKSLLMMVLHKVFYNQPKTIENTFQLIHSFNNGKIDKKNYEKTLKMICDLMNDELPSPILVYILTLVDMPQDLDMNSTIVEKMKRTHDFFPEINVRPHLLEYLNKLKPTCKTRPLHNIEVMSDTPVQNVAPAKTAAVPAASSPNFVKPVRTARRGARKLLNKAPRCTKSLLDICACYVVTHENYLKEVYKKKHATAWQLISSDAYTGAELAQCYNVVKDLNKKIKWLREIESDNISADILMEEYQNSDVFLREHHYVEPERSPFELSEEQSRQIDLLFE